MACQFYVSVVCYYRYRCSFASFKHGKISSLKYDLLFKFQALPHVLSVELAMFIFGFFKYLIMNSFLYSNTRVRIMIIWSFPHCTVMGKFLCLDGPTSTKYE